MDVHNPLGLRGIEFVEFASPDPDALHRLFVAFGFTHQAKHRSKNIDYYRQNDIHFLLNREQKSFGGRFSAQHGPSICSMGWRMDDGAKAQQEALRRSASRAEGDYELPAIYGIGESLIYFIEDWQRPDRYREMGFEFLADPEEVPEKGFVTIDHLTNNVHKGEMQQWVDFYKNIFGFSEIRYFDIRGVKTGLTSFAMQSPDRSFCIPINEGTEAKSQINEFLEEYRGPGVQHLAFTTHDICRSIDLLSETSIETLDIDDEYYQEVFKRVPNVTEDHKGLQKRQILVDGDARGYLLQIFTRNIIGPIFVEIIQRKNNFGFGEGNFGALFRSIERDQQRRGYLD